MSTEPSDDNKKSRNKKSRRTYSKSDKASALLVLQTTNGNITQTSADAGVPPSTVRDWRSGVGIDDEVLKERDIKKEQLADVFERVARKYLTQAEKDSVVDSTKGKDSVTAAAIAADKMQLLRGDPTNITQTTSLTEEQKQKLELIRRARAEVEQNGVIG